MQCNEMYMNLKNCDSKILKFKFNLKNTNIRLFRCLILNRLLNEQLYLNK